MLKYFIRQLRFLLVPGMKQLTEQLKRHEGTNKEYGRHYPYYCSAGKETIGIGRNIEANGISDDEAMYLLVNDVCSAREALISRYSWVSRIAEARQCAFINMVFNMGLGSFSGFRRMLLHAEAGEWEKAAEEAKDSKWYKKDVARWRSEQIIKQIQTRNW